MDQVINDTLAYEQLVFKYDKLHDDLNRAIIIVKKFITDNKLIIYGGTAIDYALRLRGDKIYPDDLFPDLDFYSPDNINHAYELADILYRAGFKDTRAINASHMKTMRIDLGANHFIADISFQPSVVFDVIPWLEYDHMRIVHPTFQRIDLHSALSFPYDGAPREVIFARWSKDIRRFNLLDKYYPIDGGNVTNASTIQIPIKYRKHVFHGDIAYAFIYHEYNKLNLDTTGIVPAELTITSEHINVTAERIEIVNFQSIGGDKYEPLGSIMPAREELDNVISYDTKNRLLSVNSVHIDDAAFRIVNIQYLLRHYISLHFAKSMQRSDTALSYYISLLHMIQRVEAISDIVPVFFPSIQTYGNDNLDLTRQVLLNRMYHELDNVELYSVPYNYYPGKSIPAGKPHPVFDIESSEFYRERGIKIQNKDNA